jgi:hypothetical protein
MLMAMLIMARYFRCPMKTGHPPSSFIFSLKVETDLFLNEYPRVSWEVQPSPSSSSGNRNTQIFLFDTWPFPLKYFSNKYQRCVHSWNSSPDCVWKLPFVDAMTVDAIFIFVGGAKRSSRLGRHLFCVALVVFGIPRFVFNAVLGRLDLCIGSCGTTLTGPGCYLSLAEQNLIFLEGSLFNEVEYVYISSAISAWLSTHLLFPLISNRKFKYANGYFFRLAWWLTRSLMLRGAFTHGVGSRRQRDLLFAGQLLRRRSRTKYRQS